MKVPQRLLVAISAASILLGMASVAYIVSFGSINAAMSYFDGVTIQLESSVVAVESGEFEGGVSVRNFSGQSIVVLGASHTCECAAAKSLPIEVPPRSSSRIPFSITRADKTDRVDSMITLYTDSPTCPMLVFRVVDVGTEVKR